MPLVFTTDVLPGARLVRRYLVYSHPATRNPLYRWLRLPRFYQAVYGLGRDGGRLVRLRRRLAVARDRLKLHGTTLAAQAVVLSAAVVVGATPLAVIAGLTAVIDGLAVFNQLDLLYRLRRAEARAGGRSDG